MAGIVFPEKISRYLRKKLSMLVEESGTGSPAYQGLAVQYLRDDREETSYSEKNVKHYEAGFDPDVSSEIIPGLERLYRRCLVIEPTLACIAHCRYCLRSNYPRHTLTEEQIVEVARYCGNDENREFLNEILITGGDPLLIPKRVELLLNSLIEYASNITIIRLATRVPSQDPGRVDDDVLRLFQNKPSLRFELATQINHPVEFFPEVIEAFGKIKQLGVKIYAQNVLLKGVNNNLATILALYDRMRLHDIEAHYLFHPVPLLGTHHFRPTVASGLDLARSLTSCGFISGRAKPMFALMTDIGKITLYDGSIVDNRDGKLLLQSNYLFDERLQWNPSWKLPSTAEVDSDGYLRVWYLDGED